MKTLLLLPVFLFSIVVKAQNVGIGTTMPASKLTIDGIDPDIGLMNNGLANGFIKAHSFDLKMGTAHDNATGKLMLGTKGNDHFTIDHFGRVSIGTTSNFDAALKLNGTSPIFAFLHNEAQKGFIRLGVDDFKIGTYPGNTGRIIFSPKNIDRIWIDDDGQVGIGTSTPSSLLTINGTSPLLQMRHNNANKGFIQAAINDIKIGTNDVNTTGKLILQTKAIDRILVNENGLVGIGTSNPSSTLTINGTDPIVQLRNGDVDKGFIQLVNDNIRIGTNVSNDFGSFVVRTNGTDRLFVNYKGQMGLNVTPDDFTTSFVVGEDGNGNTGVELRSNNTRRGMFNFNGLNTFLTGSSGNLYIYRSSMHPIVFYPDGNMALGGHSTAVGYRLSIHGKAIATEFTSMPYADWPDYVFNKSYRLMPLAEVKKYIEENKHLPNIPAAAEIEKNGIQLGDMSKRLMEKVEELTLYVLQLQEQIDELKKRQSEKK
jgi:hypothetical protein